MTRVLSGRTKRKQASFRYFAQPPRLPVMVRAPAVPAPRSFWARVWDILRGAV